MLRVLIIHKDDTRRGRGVLDLSDAAARGGAITVLDWPDPWAVEPKPDSLVRERTPLAPGTHFTFDLPPHSLALATIELTEDRSAAAPRNGTARGNPEHP
jgi:hypothetical protein